MLESVRAGVFTVIFPEVAPFGTVALISVFENDGANCAAVPLKVTLVVPVKLFPGITTAAATLPELGRASTNGRKPVAKAKTVPQPWVQLEISAE